MDSPHSSQAKYLVSQPFPLGQRLVSPTSQYFDLISGFYDNSTVAQAALFIKWKTISGAMLQQYGHQPNENDPRYSSITQALGAAEPVLSPFINPSADINARRRNLEGIMTRAAQFGFLLFSQPGVFEFDFTSTGQPASLVVFPALLQRVNDEAELLLPPRVMAEKEEMIKG